MPDVLEITMLSLVDGLTSEDFVAANEDVNAYLLRQPGFRWRRIVERDDGGIVDIVAYDSRGRALAGASGITGELGDSPVHATIDHAQVDWQLTTVLQLVEGER